MPDGLLASRVRRDSPDRQIDLDQSSGVTVHVDFIPQTP
jgi:hypothetical protein